MRIVRSIEEMQREADRLRATGKKIVLVPTMGYLHQGHVNLIKFARKAGDVVVLSIFVNPTQFGPNEDFERYPRDSVRDEKIAKEAGVDVIFHPEKLEMYPGNFQTYVDEQEASRVLEGKIRSSHFRGVTTVVAKLFNICKPHIAVFGQKDIQQAFIVKKMASDLNFNITIAVRPIVRESDGLAMSSRNVYLSQKDRSSATVLNKSLKFAEQKMLDGERDFARLRSDIERMILADGASSVDYVAFVNPETFKETDSPTTSEVLVALAARFGSTRLIDNILISLVPTKD